MSAQIQTRSRDRLEKPRSFWVKRAILLSWFTIGYNFIEGIIAIAFGVEEASVALAGFGVDSFIEVASACLVLWRFRGETSGVEILPKERERHATFGIGILFVFLASLTVVASVFQLVQQAHPSTTLPGLIISGLSLSFMFALWRAKQTTGRALESATVMKDADCSFACIKLSFVLLVGSLLFWIAPSLWWADSLAAIVLAILIGREGLETIQAARHPDFSGGCGCT
jgi:divalent metal cation (Fe/Co/Zn/Cd) transporter